MRKRECLLHHRDHSFHHSNPDRHMRTPLRPRFLPLRLRPCSPFVFPPSARRRSRFACRRQRRHRWCHRSRRLAAQSRYISRAVTRDRVEARAIERNSSCHPPFTPGSHSVPSSPSPQRPSFPLEPEAQGLQVQLPTRPPLESPLLIDRPWLEPLAEPQQGIAKGLPPDTRRRDAANMADKIYYPNPEIAKNAYCSSMEQYRTMHEKWVAWKRGLVWIGVES